MIKTQLRTMSFELSKKLSSDGFVKGIRAKDRVTGTMPSQGALVNVTKLRAVPVVERTRNQIFKDLESTITESVVLLMRNEYVSDLSSLE